MKKNINDYYEKFLTSPAEFSDKEKQLLIAYQTCVIQNTKTEGKLSLVFDLTDLFEGILNKM